MKLFVLLFLVLLILGGLVACSAEPEPQKEASEEESTVNNNNDEDDKPQNQKKDNETVLMIKEKVKLGLNKAEVEQLISSDYRKIKAADDDSEMWRYDFGINEGYMSPDDEYDFGDIEGLKNGIIQAQLFISWDSDDKVSHYSVIYFNSDDGKVYNYRLFSDGGEKEQAITD